MISDITEGPIFRSENNRMLLGETFKIVLIKLSKFCTQSAPKLDGLRAVYTGLPPDCNVTSKEIGVSETNINDSDITCVSITEQTYRACPVSMLNYTW